MRFQRNASLLNTPSVLSKGFVSSANVIATEENVLLSVFLLFPVSAILTALLNFARGLFPPEYVPQGRPLRQRRCRKLLQLSQMRVCPPAPFLHQKTCYDGHIRLHRSFLQSCAPAFPYWLAFSGCLRNFLIRAFCYLNEGQRAIPCFTLFFDSFYCPLYWEGHISLE